MRKQWIFLGCVALGLFVGATAGVWAGSDEGEVDVSIDQVPDAAKAVILRELKGARIKEVERETKGGVTIYEAEGVLNGKEIDGALFYRTQLQLSRYILYLDQSAGPVDRSG